MLHTTHHTEQLLLVPLFIKDLQSMYEDAVLLFWDPGSCSRIAGLWNPLVTAQRAFKVKAGWNSAPIRMAHGDESTSGDSSVNIQLNRAAILAEMKRIGGDLIASIEVNR